MKKKYCFFMVLFFVISCPILAQNYESDMTKIMGKISRADSYHITGKISIYTNSQNGKLIRSFDADVIRSSSGYRSKIDDTEIISNEKMVITIDHEEQYIQVENKPKLNKKDEELLNEIYQLSNDSTLVSASLLSSVNGINTYQLILRGDISSVEISLNMNSVSIQKIKYFYDEEKFPTGNFVTISYSRFSFDDDIDEKMIDAKDVIEKSGSELIAVGKYENYTLVNLYQD